MVIQQNARDTQVTIGTSPVEISRELQSGQRYAFTAVNTSTGGQVITISWGTETTALSGIVLYPGGTYSESVDSAYIPNWQRIWSIASAAGAVLSIHEVVLGGVS